MGRQGTPYIFNDDGFTLTEILFVLVIIAILTAIAIASFTMSTGRAAEAACCSNQRVLNGLIPAYEADNGGAAPTSVDDLAPFVKNSDTGTVCPSDDTPYQWDAATEQFTCVNHP
ncbi:MAG: prepilin-type N-terminal cleavage/methylation domain-containing protein [Anaerosomatales bacterium]|nr:prepilin-type N-terminal cleavage/methylation domain-containing protein [Anaerosomatales bacterium]